MIDLSRIRSLEKLDEMTADLKEFITNPYVLVLYIEEGLDKEDFEDDKADCEELLERIAVRRKSLENYLKGQAGKSGSRRKPKSGTKVTPSEPQSSVSND